MRWHYRGLKSFPVLRTTPDHIGSTHPIWQLLLLRASIIPPRRHVSRKNGYMSIRCATKTWQEVCISGDAANYCPTQKFSTSQCKLDIAGPLIKRKRGCRRACMRQHVWGHCQIRLGSPAWFPWNSKPGDSVFIIWDSHEHLHAPRTCLAQVQVQPSTQSRA